MSTSPVWKRETAPISHRIQVFWEFPLAFVSLFRLELKPWQKYLTDECSPGPLCTALPAEAPSCCSLGSGRDLFHCQILPPVSPLVCIMEWQPQLTYPRFGCV